MRGEALVSRDKDFGSLTKKIISNLIGKNSQMATNVDTKRQSHKISKIPKQFIKILFKGEGSKKFQRLIYLYQISARICDGAIAVRGQPH